MVTLNANQVKSGKPEEKAIPSQALLEGRCRDYPVGSTLNILEEAPGILII